MILFSVSFLLSCTLAVAPSGDRISGGLPSAESFNWGTGDIFLGFDGQLLPVVTAERAVECQLGYFPSNRCAISALPSSNEELGPSHTEYFSTANVATSSSSSSRCSPPFSSHKFTFTPSQVSEWNKWKAFASHSYEFSQGLSALRAIAPEASFAEASWFILKDQAPKIKKIQPTQSRRIDKGENAVPVMLLGKGYSGQLVEMNEFKELVGLVNDGAGYDVFVSRARSFNPSLNTRQVRYLLKRASKKIKENEGKI